MAGPALDEGESLRASLARRAPPPGFANVHPDQYGFLWIETRCFEDKSGRQRPGWYQISTNDRLIPPETEPWMAERIHARKTITLSTSHPSIPSQPDNIVKFIEEAATRR